MKIEGEAIYVDGKGRRRSIEGIGTVPDDEPIHSLKVSGSCSFDVLVCDDIKIEGECDGSTLTAKSATFDGTVKVNALKVDGDLDVSGSVRSNMIEADEIAVESRNGSIGGIKCGRIRVFEESSARNVNSRVRIKNINANEVNLQNCEVDAIKCKDAIIGSNCIIGTLNVEGNCEVVDGSTVKETIRGGSST